MHNQGSESQPADAAHPQNLHLTTRFAELLAFDISTWSSGSIGIAFGSASWHFEQLNESIKGGVKASEEIASD